MSPKDKEHRVAEGLAWLPSTAAGQISDMARAFNRLSFAGTMEHYPEGVAFVGDGTGIQDCNETFRHMTGVGVGSLNCFDAVVHPSYRETWLSGLSRFLTERSGTHCLTLKLSGNGISVRWIKLSFLSLDFPDEKSFLLILHNITGQKHLEKKLITARNDAERATRSKSDFLANTSHEIRTPIHTIIGMSDLLKNTTLNQEQTDYLEQIRFATDVLMTLLNDILDFSRLEAGQLRLERTDFSLIEMLEGALDLVTLDAHKKNVDVGLYIDPQVPSKVFGDPARLRQVVVNLMTNAVKFTCEGQIVLDVETLSVASDVVRVKFSITDSGIGIPLEKQHNLFQAFHQGDSSTTRRFGGTGLGLFISKNLVNQMGGVLSFISTPGKGSSFFFEMTFDRADESVVSPVVSRNVFSGHRILVIDDNDIIRERVSRTLEAWGFRVDEAGSAKEALFLIRSSEKETYKLIIVDQTMPHIDGWQFANEIHSDSSVFPSRMILMSMKGNIGAVEARMKLLGWFDGYLTKPVRQSDLSATVFRLLADNHNLENAGLLGKNNPDGGVESPKPFTGFRILIVEDHEVNRKLLQIILEKNGHEVLEAPNGNVACEIVVRENPDLVFMDCQMPVMNGYESTEHIRKGGYKAPVIAVTASALAEEREKCLNCGMSDLVTKPFTQADILMVIKRHLDNGKSLRRSSEANTGEEDAKIFNFRMAVKTFLGNEECVRNLLRYQMDKMEGEIRLIREAFSAKDWETLWTTAHSIKGSCRNMNMNRCGEVASLLESAGKNIDVSATTSGLVRLEEEFTLLKAEATKILSS